MRSRLIVCALLVSALPARGDVATEDPITDALMTVDQLPSTADLTTAFSSDSDAVAALQDLALDPRQTSPDPGLRMRAIRTLPGYCPTTSPGSCGPGTPVHDTLVQLITDYAARPLPSAVDLLVLRAAVEALGATGTVMDTDVALLTPLLDNTSRDVRATVVQALRNACGTDAKTVLKTLGVSESSMQVRSAIMSALQTLEQCPTK